MSQKLRPWYFSSLSLCLSQVLDDLLKTARFTVHLSHTRPLAFDHSGMCKVRPLVLIIGKKAHLRNLVDVLQMTVSKMKEVRRTWFFFFSYRYFIHCWFFFSYWCFIHCWFFLFVLIFDSLLIFSFPIDVWFTVHSSACWIFQALAVADFGRGLRVLSPDPISPSQSSQYFRYSYLIRCFWLVALQPLLTFLDPSCMAFAQQAPLHANSSNQVNCPVGFL